MPDLSAIVKAYDIRGVVGDQLDERTARALGAATARLVAADDPGPSAVVVGRDMRDSSPVLAAAFADGVTGQGLDVVDIGLASTDMLYFASGSLGLPGAMFTASHNPARYNGIKLCRGGAVPIGQDSGLATIRDDAARMLDDGVPEGARRGSLRERDMLSGYAEHLRSLVDLSGVAGLTVVVDAGNGMGGHTVPSVLTGLGLRVVPLYFELDGTFPNHEANPLDPANLVDLQKAVVTGGADLGLAFDGDADRCFAVDECGEAVSPSAITGLVAAREVIRLWITQGSVSPRSWARASSRAATNPVIALGLTASPRSSTAKQRSASPSKARPRSAPSTTTAFCRSTRFAGSSGFAS